MNQLGDILLSRGLLSEDQLGTALAEQQRQGRSLGRVLVDLGMLSENQLVAALATQIGLRFVDLSDTVVDGSAVVTVPASVCRRHVALPIGFDDGKLIVAMADPANVFAVDDFRSISGFEVRPVVATKPDVLAAIDRHHRADSGLDDLVMSVDRSDDEEDLSSVTEIVEDAPIVKFVNLLIAQAVQDRASDIHIEPTEREPARALPHRRCPARDHGVAEDDPVGRHLPAEDHVGHQHRRAPHPAGRPDARHDRRQEGRPPRGHAAHRVGREGRHANPGQLHRDAEADRPRLRARTTTRGTSRASPSRTG